MATASYEFIKAANLDYLGDFGPCDLPFSKGPCRNFFRFFVVQPGWCISTKDWLPTKCVPAASSHLVGLGLDLRG
jgi:hypothetical protein